MWCTALSSIVVDVRNQGGLAQQPLDGADRLRPDLSAPSEPVVCLEERFAFAQRVVCFRPYGAVNPDFPHSRSYRNPFQSLLNRTATGLTAKGIKAAKLKRLPVAIPPLAEQIRIVAKVDELMN
jgi:hypothetical protein